MVAGEKAAPTPTEIAMLRLITLRLSCVIAAIVGQAAAGAAAEVAASAARPNIVFLMSDDQPAGALGCYGNGEVITPNIDRLAADGMRFNRHYVTTSICMASRCTVLTGLYEYRHGCNFDHGDLDRRFFANSYAARLRAAGYFTGFAGKIGFELTGEPFENLAEEFDVWGGGLGQTDYETARNKSIARYAAEHPHSTRAYAAWARDFLTSARQSGRPFCMSISFKAPHLPFMPDPADIQRYAGRKAFARPANYGGENGKHLSPQARTSRAATGYRQWVTDYDDTIRAYYALITGVDAAVGMIRESLEQLGFAGNTVIIFTSDNGYNCGAHGFGDKVLPYEEASRVPLIIYDPRERFIPGRVSEALTANVDLAPTILALAGVPAPAGMDGKNLMPLAANPAGSVRESLPLFNFWGIRSAQSMAIVTRGWKYIYWYYGRESAPVEELFRLQDDPLEMSNVAADARHAAALDALRQAYDSELSALRQNVNPAHDYPDYMTLFDRFVPWSEKEAILSRKPSATVKPN
jgi:arylsulfatase A-like enzyme